jgi:nitroreductase
VNPKLRLIFARRSIRRYRDRPLSDGILTDLLEAAMAAPSAVAKDPWNFIIVRERATLDRIAALLPNGKMLRHAAAAFVVCGDMEKAHDGQESYLLQDCSAAIENVLLAATALGVGSCWLGIHPRPERIEGIRALFGLPPNIVPVSGISLGWPEGEKEPRTRYKSDAVHWEGWQGRPPAS